MNKKTIVLNIKIKKIMGNLLKILLVGIALIMTLSLLISLIMTALNNFPKTFICFIIVFVVVIVLYFKDKMKLNY
jgi:hypothetical protein